MRKTQADNPLRVVCAAGLALALAVSWSLVFLALFRSPQRRDGAEYAFARALREYDLLDAPKLALEGENPDLIERRLSRLQNEAGSVEERLSVLKRRRVLAFIDRRYIESYAKAAREAAERFPNSAPLAAAAAEAALLGGSPEGDVPALLKTYAPRISQNRFDPLTLGVHILAGNLDDPARAAEISGLERLLSLDFSALPEQTRRDLLTDQVLLLAGKRDTSGASSALASLLQSAETLPRETMLMGAEFYYDHNLPLNAAELFLALDDDAYSARAADALVFAGEISGARNIWLALASESGLSLTAENPFRQNALRSVYNMAASSAAREEETSWLEKLFPGQSARRGTRAPSERDLEERVRVYSVIRYTRLLDTERAIAVLDDRSMTENPLLDLELLRRKMEDLPPRRAAAEVWLLLGRHDNSEALFEWAAWYFDHQKLYDETAVLLKEAERKGMSGSWLELHRGLEFARAGKITDAEKIFGEAANAAGPAGDPPPWQIFANLGRIAESRRAVSSALEFYEAAAALVREKSSAALVQMRLSRCLETLGRVDESRHALEYALELDGENINIRRELRRLNSGR